MTGRPGSGKTTVIRRALDRIGRERCAGFYTEEVRERGRRVGFDVVTLDGRRGPLARVGARGPRVGRYGVDLASFEQLGVGTLERGLAAEVRLLVVDEIGKMELFSQRFTSLLPRLFGPSTERAVLGSVLAGRHPKVDPLRDLVGLRIIEVGPGNRDELAGELVRIYGEYLERTG